jgi:hypothetical protein
MAAITKNRTYGKIARFKKEDVEVIMNVDVINSLVYYRYFRYEFLLSFTLVN